MEQRGVWVGAVLLCSVLFYERACMDTQAVVGMRGARAAMRTPRERLRIEHVNASYSLPIRGLCMQTQNTGARA